MKQIDIQFRTFRLKDDSRTFFCTEAKCDYNLNVLGVAYITIRGNSLPANWNDSSKWQHLPNARLKDIIIPDDSATLNGAYTPAAELENAKFLDVLTPDSMDESTAEALNQLKKAVGNVAEFVAERLQYSLEELAECLALEQIDAVALAIYNAEARNQGMIIGDQTGIGKGRVAAAFIRYGVIHGHKPIFFTENASLFNDIYRDLIDIHCEDYKPLMINSNAAQTDDDGNIVYSWDEKVLKAAFADGKVPDDCQYVCCTYSQLPTNTTKQDFIAAIAENNIIVLDEAHNAGGEVEYNKDGDIVSGKIAAFFQENVIGKCKSVIYLSATYAKSPKNMPIYAQKTCISDIDDGGYDVARYFVSLPAAEIISSSMARFGQFIRRERITEGMNVNYYTLDASDEDAMRAGYPDLKEQHWQVYQNITNIYSRIRRFQEKYFQPYLADIAETLAAQGSRQSKPPTVASASLMSSLFHLTNNILLSLKALPVAERTLQLLKEGKKVVIALADTNESVLKNRNEAGKKGNVDEGDDSGVSVEVREGQTINADYTKVFDTIFKNLFYYNIRQGRKVIDKVYISVDELGEEAVEEYKSILELFSKTTSGLCFSPIDVIRERIEREGYQIGECTGRKTRIKFTNGNYYNATVTNIDKFSSNQEKHKALCFRKFNNNEIDVMIINQSGSTGKSAHATNKNTKLRPDEVKQRVMIIAQAELDVNTEVQKRGRINRTGQFAHIPPQYEYIFSAIPCEKRFMMMLKAKLKSLDANTTSNQKNSNETVLKTDDFFNKYGDKIVEDVLKADLRLNHTLNDPLGVEPDPVNPKRTKQRPQEMARTVFGRMQILPADEQEKYYDMVLRAYNAKVEQLKADDEFDLEMKEADFQAKKISENILRQVENDGTHSELKGSAFLTRYSIKAQAKFMSVKNINETLNRNTQSGLADTDGILKRLKDDYEAVIKDEKERHANRLQQEIDRQQDRVTQTSNTIEDFIEAGMSAERIDKLRENLKEATAKLKDLKKGVDPEFDERLADKKATYEEIRKLLDKLRVGQYFERNSNIYCVLSVNAKIGDSGNIYNAPSNILISLTCTDPMSIKGVNANFAENDRENILKELVKKPSSEAAYTKFIKDDSRREEVSIITGNIVPYLSEEGTVITRYTLYDGSMENGIVVKPKLVNDQWEYPEWAKFAYIPLNDKTIRPIMSSLSSETRMNLMSQVGNGEFYIEGRRFGGDMEFVLFAERGYIQFLNREDIKEQFDLLYGEDVPFVQGMFRVTIKNLRKFLEKLNEFNFSARVAITALEHYADALDFSKYKAKDWIKLSYDRNKIPTGYTGHKPKRVAVPMLLLTELKLLKSGADVNVDDNIRIIDYSEHAWAVVGNTMPIRYTLKQNGGHFNKFLKIGGKTVVGWIFSKNKFSKTELYNIIREAA